MYGCESWTLKKALLPVLSLSFMSDSLQQHGLQPARFLCPWGFSRIIWGFSLTHMRIPIIARILEWVAMPSSRGSSQPRNWTQEVSCIVGRLFIIWATRESHMILSLIFYSMFCSSEFGNLVNMTFLICCICSLILYFLLFFLLWF